jgi:hypothetical protein
LLIQPKTASPHITYDGNLTLNGLFFDNHHGKINHQVNSKQAQAQGNHLKAIIYTTATRDKPIYQVFCFKTGAHFGERLTGTL